MAWACEPLHLKSDNLQITTLQAGEVSEVSQALLDPEGWYARRWQLDHVTAIAAMLEKQLQGHHRQNCHPMVYRVVKNGNTEEVAGITRFMRLDETNKTLEIGGTWVGPRWQNTFVNTHVKSLLLEYAFAQLGVERVEFRVDERNHRSMINVLRLGAQYEGRLHHRQIYPNGEVASGRLYALVKPDWPATKRRLGELQQGVSTLALLAVRPCLANYEIRPYRLSDAPELLSLLIENEKDLRDSFPATLLAAQSLESVCAYIADIWHSIWSHNAFYFGVWETKTQKMVGQLQIKNLDWAARSAELGYLVDQNVRRRGLGLSLVQAAVDELVGRHHLQRIYARVLKHNIASERLLLRAGFECEGVLRSAFRDGNGSWVDVQMLAKVIN